MWTSKNNRILLLSTESTAQVALLIDSLVGLRSVQGMHLQPDSNDSKQLFSKQTYTDDDNNEWLELDTEALVQNKEFVQPI